MYHSNMYVKQIQILGRVQWVYVLYTGAILLNKMDSTNQSLLEPAFHTMLLEVCTALQQLHAEWSKHNTCQEMKI